jgi:cytochrome c553
MWGISALLTDEQIEGFADYYAAQSPAPGKSTQPKLEAAGKLIYEKGLPAKGVLPCKQCHGDNAEGAAGFPRLAGQRADYVLKQLQAFRTPLRPHGVVMKNEIAAMTPQQLKAVAAYVQSR